MTISKTLTAKEYAYSELKEQILKLQLTPGTKISEKTMAERLQVSRTPIREAFLRLAQEELLTIIPQSGTFVSLINLDFAEEARFVREQIETAVAALCCETIHHESLVRLEANIKMQEYSARTDIEPHEKNQFFDLDEQFHKELFDWSGKQRTWQMLQGMTAHLNRFRLLRLMAKETFDKEILIDQHKAIYSAICNQNKAEVKKIETEHLRLMLSEKEILLREFPEYFSRN
ncbi:DNA-binding GntR family transcriptional regulator [Pullulanibacillus pueri]|uniref:GntR family transcriptional regulator n=1 Tax=Pullulanibacillus pueri TaxID=1437324 RepID=A0A8J3EMF1_9BACL|nr:GntR family transcriptional regulator [Pullulanibacillus pueri]MBM7682603.1 DNA-binding GntR family transcriptional regulator [Pullulanibacillus pueri]GGH82469.1 GntR family transcriptional regulator [Pullulanibacillus pueri]